MLDVETEARWLLRGMGDTPLAHELVERHVGVGRVFEVEFVPAGDAMAVEGPGGWVIRHRHGLRGVRLRWALLHELAEIHLARLGYRDHDTEAVAERLAAALAMPHDAFIDEAWSSRMSLPELAAAFAVTQTAVTLRLAEVGLVSGAAVVHPQFTLQRGTIPDDAARLLKKPVTDAPMRMAILAA